MNPINYFTNPVRGGGWDVLYVLPSGETKVYVTRPTKRRALVIMYALRRDRQDVRWTIAPSTSQFAERLSNPVLAPGTEVEIITHDYNGRARWLQSRVRVRAIDMGEKGYVLSTPWTHDGYDFFPDRQFGHTWRRRKVLRPNPASDKPLNPHNWLSALKSVSQPKLWQCNCCGDVGTYEELLSRPCAFVYPPCPYCGLTPACSPTCAGMIAALTGEDVYVSGQQAPPPETKGRT